MEKGNDSGIVFYYSYKEFKENYNDNFYKWLELYPDGTENDFKCEYLELYKHFYSTSTSGKIIYSLSVAFINDWTVGIADITEWLNEPIRDISNLNLLEEQFADKCFISSNLLEINAYIERVFYAGEVMFTCDLLKPVFQIEEVFEGTYFVDLNEPKYKNFQYSVVRIVEFLLGRNTEQGRAKEHTELAPCETIPQNNNVKFNIRPTELVELVKALYESGKVKGKMKDLYSYFGSVFNVDVKNPDKLLQDIRNRNNDSKTLFLDNLKTSLLDYIVEKDEKNRR